MRIELVMVGAMVVVVGCATARREEPAPQPLGIARSPWNRDLAGPAVPERVHHLDVSPELPAGELGKALGDRARAIGVEAPIAFVWGDVKPVPAGARRAEIRAQGSRVSGWLVGSANSIDMGQLAPDIHDVVLVSAEKNQLFASHPSGSVRSPLDLELRDAESRRDEVFAFVSLEPGDIGPEARAGEVLALLDRLPGRVRYAVMALRSEP